MSGFIPWSQVDLPLRAYREKYVAPRTGARATIFEEHTDLYRVHVKHVMTSEYGIVATRTDWRW